MNFNALLENKFALLFISVLLLILAMPFMSGKLLISVPFILIILMLGVLRTLSLSKPLMIGCAAVGVLATILHFTAVFVATPAGDSQIVTNLTLGALTCYCIFLGTSILGLLSAILGRHEITHDTICYLCSELTLDSATTVGTSHRPTYATAICPAIQSIRT